MRPEHFYWEKIKHTDVIIITFIIWLFKSFWNLRNLQIYRSLNNPTILVAPNHNMKTPFLFNFVFVLQKMIFDRQLGTSFYLTQHVTSNDWNMRWICDNTIGFSNPVPHCVSCLKRKHLFGKKFQRKLRHLLYYLLAVGKYII